MKKGTSKPLTRAQLEELKSLAALPDEAIDTSDAPEVLDWSDSKRGLFYFATRLCQSFSVPCALTLVNFA